MIARLTDLALLMPEFRARLERLLAELAAEKIPLAVFEAARSPERQAALYQIGRDPDTPSYGRTVTRAMPYESAHQFGLAADLVYRIAGRWTWEEPQPGMWDTMAKLAARAGLTTLSFERPHVQLPADLGALPRGPADTAGWMAWLRGRVAR